MKKINIRLAVKDDFEWVSDLMNKTLNSFYGGNHLKHAKRIFDAHISGGIDKMGFFSFEQKMFILELDGERAGMLHLVGKRQSTYKISPLIIDKKYRKSIHKAGSLLLKYAECYAKKQKARQLFCTVSVQNQIAYSFLKRNGFVDAGRSDNHYKIGITESMLYKPLDEKENVFDNKDTSISIVPLDENNLKIMSQVRSLLLCNLKNSFDGVDNKWVDRLFNGYSRRKDSDINTKYKLIFVAIDNKDNVVGVSGITHKKGNPIKLMPFVASNILAFNAMLIDLPGQLSPFGHKLYVHINPTANQVVSFQKFGWTLNALLPSAYRTSVITQQWSIDLGVKTLKSLRLKHRFYELIKLGKKNLEIRVGYTSIKKIQSGDYINLLTENKKLKVLIKEKRIYTSFATMLKHESWKQIAPDLSSEKQVLSLLQKIYPAEKEKLGVIVLEIEIPAV